MTTLSSPLILKEGNRGTHNKCQIFEEPCEEKFSRTVLKESSGRRLPVRFQQRLARNVCKSNDLVAYEDLRIRNMVKCHNRAKSISDSAALASLRASASWYQLRVWIEHFAKKFGKKAIAVPPYNTSQECCICGKKVQKELKVRTHSCTCGLSIHRDINAAINILLKAKSTVGQTGSNACLSRGLYASWSNPARGKPRR